VVSEGEVEPWIVVRSVHDAGPAARSGRSESAAATVTSVSRGRVVFPPNAR
jgi:hypothetical protein